MNEEDNSEEKRWQTIIERRSLDNQVSIAETRVADILADPKHPASNVNILYKAIQHSLRNRHQLSELNLKKNIELEMAILQTLIVANSGFDFVTHGFNERLRKIGEIYDAIQRIKISR